MAVSFIVSKIKRDIGRKTPLFHTPFHLTCTVTKNPFEFVPKILIHSVRVHELLGGAKLLTESLTLCLACNNVTDRQQTDGRQTDGQQTDGRQTDGRLTPLGERNVVTFA